MLRYVDSVVGFSLPLASCLGDEEAVCWKGFANVYVETDGGRGLVAGELGDVGDEEGRGGEEESLGGGWDGRREEGYTRKVKSPGVDTEERGWIDWG